jgi:hypothetical protein
MTDLTFVDSPPPVARRRHTSALDSLRGKLIANSGKWAKLESFPKDEPKSRINAMAKCTRIKGSKLGWQDHAWEAQVSETDTTYDVWARNVDDFDVEPEPEPEPVEAAPVKRSGRKAVAAPKPPASDFE